MYRILCYGDSNTWGYRPIISNRYEEGVRWTSIVQNILGDNYKIIEEGLCGRTTIFNDPITPNRSGKEMLLGVLDSQSPLDVIVLMLGTNDLKRRFNLTAFDISNGIKQLLDLIKNHYQNYQVKRPEIILLCPPEIGENLELTDSSLYFSKEHSLKESKNLAKFYKPIAESYNCTFVNANDITEVSEDDCVHFSEKGHKMFAEGIASYILDACNKIKKN